MRSALALVAALVACAPRTSSPAPAPAPPAIAYYDPAHDLGALFAAVQLASVFPDSKTFVDARPLGAPASIVAEYDSSHSRPSFDLRAFVRSHFALPDTPAMSVASSRAGTMEEHIITLWAALTRPADHADPHSSLIPLPHPYVVPGGRFREVYYWDSYFTMLGLVESGRTDLVKDMLDNFAHLAITVGHIPNGNRSYYLGRSQPPYLGAMVGLYASATDSSKAAQYIDALEREHAFWMDGASKLAPGTAWRRAVRLPSGAILNRYWDDIPEPRPESYREDYALAQTVPDSMRESLYRNLRAGAESGWDFSSRWMRDPKNLRTLEVIDLAPVDLNTLLYHLERTLAALYRHRSLSHDLVETYYTRDRKAGAHYDSLASARKSALLAASYDSATGWFYDVRWRTGERVSDRPTLAAVALLYFGLATREQGSAVADRLARDFLARGGFPTTLIASGQQWDAPNGWAPLEWLAIEGARCYDHAALADSARDRWLALNRRVFAATGKMTEKYDVADSTRAAGGGEYPTQDGFGWTNGVALALSVQKLEDAAGASGNHDRDAASLNCWR